MDHNNISCMRPGSFSFFYDGDFDIQTAYKACVNDIIQEANSSEDLFNAAQENLETTIQALLTPILGDDYIFVWENNYS